MNDLNVKNEEEFISILLKNKEYAYKWLEKGPELKCFSNENKLLLKALADSTNNDVLLTKKGFINYLKRERSFSNYEISSYEHLYDRIYLLDIDENNFPTLSQSIIDNFIDKVMLEQIQRWKENKDKGKNRVVATRNFVDGLSGVVGEIQENKPVIFESTKYYVDTAINEIEKNKNLSDEEYEKNFIKTNIKELDEAMVTGLAPGNLTLFCADVGHFKTGMMINIAINVWESGHNVLFVPLEMSRSIINKKYLSRVSKVPFDHLMNPKKLLTDSELQKLKKTADYVKNKESEFYIMEKPFQTTVNDIRREIEKHLEIFKPKLLVVDYVGILSPDDHIKDQRHDLQIGLMLKALRAMGKENAITKDGFSIISGAQIGREALKRVRRQGQDKTQFFSEDLRNSHELGADSDNIFAQMKNPSQPNERLDIFHIKTRHGKPFFSNGENKISLSVQPSISLIEDIDNSWYLNQSEDILSKVEDSDIDINDSFEDIDFDNIENNKSELANDKDIDDIEEELHLEEFSEDFDNMDLNEI